VSNGKSNNTNLLARLQQFLIVGGIGLVLIAVTWSWFFGRVAWGAVVAGLVIAGYAAVLAMEFPLLRFVRGDDTSPAPSVVQLLRAWWGEVRSAPLVFAWRQPFFSQRWPDQLPAAAQGQRGVLLVHGFFCNRGIWNAWLKRLTHRGVPFVAVNLEPVFGSIDHHRATIEAAVETLRACTGRAPLIVAHSMGGLAVRRWWADRPDHMCVHRLITIGTPHQGTWLARFAFSLNGRQMRRHSPWLQALSQNEPAGRAQHITCFYSHCDNIVFPPGTATLMGADNRHLPGVAHVQMADELEPWEEALRWLE
jgi:triacylglycerol lipase